MRKQNLLKLVMMVVAMFVFTGAMAQTHDGTTVPGTPAVTFAATGTTYMMVGTTIPLYTQPDSYYHPNYDPTTGTFTLTDDFTWEWAVTAGVAGNVTFGVNNSDDVYTTVEITVVGSYTISVKEIAPAAFNSCESNEVEIDIEVVTEPEATIGGDADYEACENDLSGLPAGINLTTSEGWQNYRVVWNLQIHTLDNLGAIDFYYDNEDGDGADPVQKYAVEYDDANPYEMATADTDDITTVAGFNVIANQATVYTYTLVSVNDQASRFGDFITLDGDASDASAFWYNPMPEVITIVVNPVPVTGPIYHIPATWAE